MANETTTSTADDIFLAAVVTDAILEELRPYNVMRPLFRVGPAGNSKSYDFPIQDKPAIAATVAEATDLANTSLTTSKATATVGQIGIMTTVTDLLKKVSILDAMSQFQGVLARSVAEKFETDATALLAGFSNVSSAGGSQTVANFLAAISALEQRDMVGRLVSVLHPKPAGELRAALTTATGAWFGNDSNDVTSLVKPHLEGYVGQLFGVPIWQSTLVPTSDAGVNRAGAIFVANEALGLYEQWGVRAELQRDASFRATEIVVSQCYGVVEISDTRGQTVKSTA